MATLTFPSEPVIGQQYVADNGVTYEWDGVKWTGVGISGSTSGSSASSAGNFAFSVDTMYNYEGNEINLLSQLGLVNADAGVIIPADANVAVDALQIFNGAAGVIIDANGNQYKFIDGDLTLPEGGDILDSSGRSVINELPPGAASIERVKVNYAANGAVASLSDATSGISQTTIESSSGGEIALRFDPNKYNTPPYSVTFYGYDYTNNKYIVVPLETSVGLREVAAGGTSGSPALFDGTEEVVLRLRVRESETGASRGGFGTVTHAWIKIVI